MTSPKCYFLQIFYLFLFDLLFILFDLILFDLICTSFCLHLEKLNEIREKQFVFFLWVVFLYVLFEFIENIATFVSGCRDIFPLN